MEPTMSFRIARTTLVLLSLAVVLALSIPDRLQSADMTFNWLPTAPATYDWDTPSSNWQGGIVADGAGNTASFTANNPAGVIINVNNPHTIGNLILNSRAAGSGWTLGG